MGEWVKVSEFAKLANIPRTRAYERIKKYPEYMRKIGGVNHVNADLLDVLSGKDEPVSPFAESAPDPLADKTPPTIAQPDKEQDDTDLTKAREEIARLSSELADARQRNDELNRQIVDIVKKMQEQTDKILQIADQAQQLERVGQMLLQGKEKPVSLFRRLFGKKG